MRRVLFCLLWFVLLAFVSLTVAGMVVALNTCPETEEFSVGYECGRMASEQFMARYRLPIVLGALLLSVAGTLAGVLPGTRKRAGRG
ncbi:hypothetical protein FKV24_004965 [Lysobacter maris]|uniref:Uncharacterized protein n=1 Tax=Marilutibacter maris TaxID=1605891 RepID=A0A508B0V9_9GAMM|nr:hypothetical protein [Lysobacter maris]KAB8195623.1 hypothetical protein FKV24_004965 [Lysobacter maris]